MTDAAYRDMARNLDQSSTDGTKAGSIDERRNRSGLFVYEVSPIQKLRRFLCLGSTSNTYYVEKSELNREHAKNLEDLIANNGLEVVKEIVEFSVGGRAAKEDNILLALAMAARLGNDEVRHAAYDAVPKVCRAYSALSKFVKFHTSILPNSKGWGTLMRKAVAAWYTGKNERDIAYQITKYPQREGLAHRDLLLLGHVKPDTDLRNMIFKYAVKGFDQMVESIEGDADKKREVLKSSDALILIEAVTKLKACKTAKEAAAIIREYELVHECVPSELKDSPEVWEALLQNMPVKALVWNIGKMTSYGLLGPNSATAKKVIEELGNSEQIRRSRLHPYAMMNALNTYAMGHGYRLNWNPNPQIKNAMSDAFYECFKYSAPSGKRLMVATDVSPSMAQHFVWQGQRDKEGRPQYNQAVTARQAAAAMAMAIVRTEQTAYMTCFADGLAPLDVDPKTRLDNLLLTMAKRGTGWNRTDIALPFTTAREQKIPVDTFVILTDNETNVASEKPIIALNKYREAMGIPANLVVVAFTSDKFSIADPSDNGMMDIPGFDAAAPKVISDFAAGRV